MWFRLCLLFLSFLFFFHFAQRENYAAGKNLWTFNILCKIRQIFKTWTHLLGQCQLVLFNFPMQTVGGFDFLNGRHRLCLGARLLDERSHRSHCSNAKMTTSFFLCIIGDLRESCVIVLGFFPGRFSPASQTSKLLCGKNTLTLKKQTTFIRVVACLLPQPCVSSLIPHSLCYINEPDSSDDVFFGHLNSSLCMNEPLLVSWETINKILNKTHTFLYYHEALCLKWWCTRSRTHTRAHVHTHTHISKQTRTPSSAPASYFWEGLYYRL